VEQAKHFAQSLLKGDPDAGGVLRQSIKGMVDKLTPHKG
jgi:pyruvate dehydrogenase (quinone)